MEGQEIKAGYMQTDVSHGLEWNKVEDKTNICIEVY